MNIIIFSKNRPGQLDLLLRSIQVYWENISIVGDINILYTFDTRFKSGYDIVKQLHPDINWIKQTNFKLDILRIVNPYDTCTMFLCDDDVFKMKVSHTDLPFKVFASVNDVYCISLRLGKNLTHSYNDKKRVKLPKLSKQNVWDWTYARKDWGYPNSVNGNIYRTHQIMEYLRFLKYRNPNTLEGLMAINLPIIPYMVCYKESRLLNIPVNKVQTVWDNAHGDISAEKINNDFMKGLQISLKNIDGLINTSCHQEIQFQWESR